jgi:S1-C subfamily serine protease
MNMNKLFVIAASISILASTAFAWEPEEMNAVIDQTNFIVNRGCSGTLISLEPPLILTNHHCVDQNIRTVDREVPDANGKISKIKELKLDPVTVEQVAYDGHETVGSSTYVAEIVAHQRNRDLAVLQLRATSIPYTIFSPLLPEGETVKRGEEVWAVGNPAGLDATVTNGIISSVTRTFQFPWAENEDLPMIQTDVGIFGGNSGGALYDTQGRIVGVPAAGHSQATHLGLAIPTSIVWEVLAKNCLASLVGGTDDKECNEEADSKDAE